jgi:signal peptide peptidase SppA
MLDLIKNILGFFFGRFFRKSNPIIPVVRMQGMIAASSSPRRNLSMAMMAPLLDKAFSTKNAAAVAIVINSPGGSPVQSSLIFERIRYLSKENGTPVLTFIEDVAASGGYWLACAGDEIFVSPSSVVGSIGVVSAGFGFEGAIEKLGVTRRVYTSGKRKVMLDPFQPEDKEDISHLKSLQKDIHDQFITMVKSCRGSKLSADDDLLFSGAFWTGAKAIELGLVDKIGEIRQTLKSRFGDKVQIKLIEPKRSLLGMSAGSGGVSTRLAEASIDHLIEVVEEKLARSRLGL